MTNANDEIKEDIDDIKEDIDEMQKLMMEQTLYITPRIDAIYERNYNRTNGVKNNDNENTNENASEKTNNSNNDFLSIFGLYNKRHK